MRKLIAISLLALVGCKKETPKPNPTPTPVPTCDCYDKHYAFDPNLGWAYTYSSDTTQRNCADETGQWVYENPNQTLRYIVICQ